MTSAATQGPRLKVFISYSRADYGFADELVEGLEYDGKFEVSIDRHSIVEGEDWKARLGALIADADSVVFILSPQSAQSDICAWEVEHAHNLSKRILPVLWQPLGNIGAPARLAALNYVRFDEDRSFMKGLKALVTALNADIDWLREHTRLLARAREWEEAGRSNNRLLTGEDISAAKTWVAERPKDAPEPTELHMMFIKASEAADTARRDAELQRQAELARLKADAELQKEKERARRKQNRLYAVAGALLAVLIAMVSWQWYEATKQGERMERALQTVNVSLCSEAVKVTNVLATTSDEAVWDSNYDLFWALYWGPMIALETIQKELSPGAHSPVEAEMVSFGRALIGEDRIQGRLVTRALVDEVKAVEARAPGLPRAELQAPAGRVKNECAQFTDSR